MNCIAAGHIAQAADGALIVGKVGKDLTTEEGYAAAERVALSLISTLKSTFLSALCGSARTDKETAV